MKKLHLDWHLCHPGSDFREAKRTASARFLGLQVRGQHVKTVAVATEILANLVGVGVAEKRTNRQPCGVPAITFYVERKLPKSRLNRRLMLPRTIAGLTCDVVACGRLRPATGNSPSDRLDPLVPGAQVQVGGAEAGTLGAFVQDSDGDTCLISNCHVLSSDLATAEGQPVYQPGIGFPGSRQVATVKMVVPIRANGRNLVDVGIARLDPGVDHEADIPGVGRIIGTGRPSRVEPVAKFGQATLGTVGQFDSMDADVVVPYDFMTASFANVYVFRPGNFADSGDSGSVVVEPQSGTAVGIVFATSLLLNFAIPIEAVDDALPGLAWL